MKIRQATLKIFMNDVRKLKEDIIPELERRSAAWLSIQRERETYGNADPDLAYFARHHLEKSLDEFRESISKLYDFQNERGLVDVHATSGE